MKNLITSVLILIASVGYSNSTPTPVIVNEAVEVTNLENVSIFHSADFNMKSHNLEFEMKNHVDVIQIYNLSGSMTYKIDVNSNSVRLHKNLFEKGESKLGFKMDGSDTIHFMNVKVN